MTSLSLSCLLQNRWVSHTLFHHCIVLWCARRLPTCSWAMSVGLLYIFSIYCDVCEVYWPALGLCRWVSRTSLLLIVLYVWGLPTCSLGYVGTSLTHHLIVIYDVMSGWGLPTCSWAGRWISHFINYSCIVFSCLSFYAYCILMWMCNWCLFTC